MTKERFEQIKQIYNTFIIADGDVPEAFAFVHQCLIAEAEHLKEAEPYAAKTIEQLERAAISLART